MRQCAGFAETTPDLCVWEDKTRQQQSCLRGLYAWDVPPSPNISWAVDEISVGRKGSIQGPRDPQPIGPSAGQDGHGEPRVGSRALGTVGPTESLLMDDA